MPPCVSVQDVSYLGQKGYTIPKSKFTPAQLDQLKDSLMARPQSMGQTGASFPIYRESNNKIYMPRYFGIQHFGPPHEVNLPDGDPIDVPFRGSLREHQIPAIDAYLNLVREPNQGHAAGLLELSCASGKCLGKDTPILMYDGSIKPVQEVGLGDLLMGDDSTPRRVLSLTKGRDVLYRVTDPYGESYVVNRHHILSLKWVKSRYHAKEGDVLDINILDFLRFPKTYRGPLSPLRGFRVPITFPTLAVPLDPYLVGYAAVSKRTLHGDTVIEMNDTIVHLYFYYLFRTQYPELNLEYTGQDTLYRITSYDTMFQTSPDTTTPTAFVSAWTDKKIPQLYKCNSTNIRYKVLAGLLDSISNSKYDDKRHCYVVSSTDDIFVDDITYVARSLGFLVINKRRHQLSRITIRGPQLSQIPVLCSRNKIHTKPTMTEKTSLSCMNLTHLIKITREEEPGEYYGFHINQNCRFVLGDFTVTHNTVMSLNLISQLRTKTLIIVNKAFLLNQWIERIQEFLPTARVGKIQGPIVDIDQKDIVIGMLQSLSMKNYPASTFASFGLTVLDEVHHISSEVFSAALFKIVTKYMLGLSATMERKDGTTNVIKMFLGDVTYKAVSEEQHNVLVRAIEYRTQDTEFQETEYDFRGNPQYSKMIVKLCEFGPRSEFIVHVVQELIQENPQKQIMILGHNRSLLTYLHDAIVDKGFATVGYYVGGMKQQALQETETRQIVVATYSMAAEALDIKTLSTLVMVTPKTDIVQSVGRILRTKHSRPLIIDIVDMHQLFQNQWHKRRVYYKRCNYHIQMTDSVSYVKGDMNMWRNVFVPKVSGAAASKKCTLNEGVVIEEDGDEKAKPKCLIDVQGM